MLLKLLDGLQTTSVDEFNATFHHLALGLKTDFTHQSHQHVTIEFCLDLAETLFVDHKEHGTWVGLPAGNLAGGFIAGTGVELVCWNCGTHGHLAPNCPQPPSGRARTDDDRASSGRGGRGGGRGQRSAFTVPPDAGAPHIKTIDGKLCKYCNRCRRWHWGPKAHLTEEHVVGAGRQTTPSVPAVVATHVARADPTPVDAALEPSSGRTAPPVDPVVVDLMTDDERRTQRANWSASVLSAFSGTPSHSGRPP